MSNTYQIYLISDSTGETLDRVFLAIKAQFKNIEYNVKSYFFTRTENQVNKIMEEAKKSDNAIILYTIVDTSLAKHLANKGDEKKEKSTKTMAELDKEKLAKKFLKTEKAKLN